jgi:hypothetical protein
MRSSKPPALATWMLEHLKPGRRNEALPGDLLEQFNQGRSVTWYWHQVLIAIWAGFVKEWRIFVWASVLTAGWAFPLYYGHLWSNPFTEAVFGMETRRSWPMTLIVATASLVLLAQFPVFLAASLYWVRMDLTMKHRPRKRYLWLLKGYITVTLSTFLLLAFLPTRRQPILSGNLAGLVPVFFGMLVSMWAVRPENPSIGTAKLFRIDPPSNW